MIRSHSSLLAFKLREFLDNSRANVSNAVRKAPFVPATSPTQVQLPQPPSAPMPSEQPMTQQPQPFEHPTITPPPKKEDMVWVDAFFYGFYIEKSKVASFQSSLKTGANPKSGVPPRR